MIRVLDGHKVVELIVMPEVLPGFSHLKVVYVVSVWSLMCIRLTVFSPSHSGGQMSTAKQWRLGEALNLRCPVSRFWLQIFLSWQGISLEFTRVAFVVCKALLLEVDCDQMEMKRPSQTTWNSPRRCFGSSCRHGGRVPSDTAFAACLLRNLAEGLSCPSDVS